MISFDKYRAALRLSYISFLCLFLIACASKPPVSEQEQVAMINNNTLPKDEVFIMPKPKEKAYVHNAAIKRLIQRAANLTEQERYESAIQELERGLAIAPNNPHIWQNLALVRLHQGRYWQAEQLASKSNALSQGDIDLLSINGQIIAAAKEEQQTQ